MNIEEFKLEAIKHWNYNEKVIRVCIGEKMFTKEEMLAIAKTLYIESMCHGFKHGKEEVK